MSESTNHKTKTNLPRATYQINIKVEVTLSG
jgi:hypothetical protein